MDRTKLIIGIVILLWITSASIASYVTKDVEEERVVTLVKQLFRDRKAKDSCLNNLNYNDSQLVFQGLSNKCQEKNDIMEQIYKDILEWITFPYQETDKVIEEANKEPSKLEQLEEIINDGF